MKKWLKSIFSSKNDVVSVNQVKLVLDENVKSDIDPITSPTISADSLNQVGDAYFEACDYLSAETAYRQALTIDPHFFDALINLGLALDEQKKYVDSEEIFRRALGCKPNSALARFNLAVSLKNQLRLDEAETYLCQAIHIWPIFFQCHNVLGEILQSQNRIAEAIASFERAIEISEGYSVAHKNLGDSFVLLSKFDEAKLRFLRAIELAPNYAEAYYSLGFLYSSMHQLLEAEQSYQRALEIKPNFAHAHCNLGFILLGSRRYKEVEYHLKKAIELNPFLVEAYCNLGIVYNEEKRFSESEACYLTAISVDPQFANAYSCYGVLLMQNGEMEKAIEQYRKGVALDPNNLIAHSNLIMSLSFFNQYTADQYKNELQSFSDKVSALAKPYSNWRTTSVDKSQPKLKIGFVSGDFHLHPVSFFLESVISSLNLETFELVAYSNHPYEDEITARLKPFFRSWNLVTGISDEILAEKIHQDGIHILVDLAGHTANNRLPVFAWKAAPVQISWLGYFASTGLTEMDYVVSDPVAVQKDQHNQFTEKVWYVPNTRLCFTPPEQGENSQVMCLPALENDFLTFGCFQGMAKLTDEVLSLWAKVFECLPSAKLRLQNKHMSCTEAKQQMLERFVSFGIDADRVELFGTVSRREYLEAHRHVDMILDTFPYTGGTTTCEALWMGVPTLTLNGTTMLSRQGASMLTCAGLSDWIAEDEDEYVRKAIDFASDLSRLSALREGLREQVLASPLFDGKLFARNFETALIDMWFSKNSDGSTR